MTKKQRAQAIFGKLFYTNTRQEIIKVFMSELDMTSKGAATYYAACKKAHHPSSTSSFQLGTSIDIKLTSNTEVTPDWKQKVLDKHDQLCKLAERLYNVDMSNIPVTFDIKSNSLAGEARQRYNRTNGTFNYFVRYNPEAMEKYPEEGLGVIIPHELAHIICFKKPCLGKDHNNGWKLVCESLGGRTNRCHTMTLTSGRKTTKYLYIVNGVHLHVGPKVHRKIAAGNTRYTVNKTKDKMLASHFVKMVEA